MAKSLVLSNTAVKLGVTPFMAGRNAMALNQTVGALILQKSDTLGGTYVTLATVPANGTIEIPTLPPFIKVSTVANVTLIAGP